MSFPRLTPLKRCVSFLGSAAIFSAALASAQSSTAANQSSSAGYSSSNDHGSIQLAEFAAPAAMAALPSAPKPSSSASGQEGGGRGGWRQSLTSNFALELGGGLNAPTNKTYITWGGQFTVGGGINFSKRFALLAEYQFMDNKLPGKLIAETGATGGHAHIWSLTLDPVVSLFPKSQNDVYVTGGGGFYRKVTSFTDVLPQEFCSFYYCGIGYTPQVVGHFSSNQGGFNIGGGYQHRMGGMYGDSKMKLFAEVRYVDAFTPAVTTQPNGLGTTSVAKDTKVIPISVGVRW
ncbi:MAG TPA: hypothetical protein VH308_08645 [Terracidiphilus sp.]|nr:hypothetical protein [Terracidiphilus sp.]